MIPTQQLAQMRAALGVALIALGFAYRACGLERLGNLVVQFNPVGRDTNVQLPGSLRSTFCAKNIIE